MTDDIDEKFVNINYEIRRTFPTNQNHFDQIKSMCHKNGLISYLIISFKFKCSINNIYLYIG